MPAPGEMADPRRVLALRHDHPAASAHDRLCRTKPIFTRIPATWKAMTPEGKNAASEEMAKAIQRQLGIKPTD